VKVMMPALLVGLFAVQSLVAISGSLPEQVLAYQLQRPIVIDGKYNMTLTKAIDSAGREIWIDEWNQTKTYAMFTLYPESVRNGTGHFACAYDKDHLYVLWDFISCKTKLNFNNFANIRIGLFHHNRTTPNNNYDFAFSMSWVPIVSSSLMGHIGTWTGDAWKFHHIYQGERLIYFASDLGTSSNSLAEHLIFEAKIPLSEIRIKDTTLPIGICAFMGEWISMKEEIALSYPYDTDGRVPNRWADLKLMTIPIPEFSNVSFLLAASIALIPILLRRSRNLQRFKHSRNE